MVAGLDRGPFAGYCPVRRAQLEAGAGVAPWDELAGPGGVAVELGAGVAPGGVAEAAGDGVPLVAGLGDPVRLGVRDGDGGRVDAGVRAGVLRGAVGAGVGFTGATVPAGAGRTHT